MRKFCYLIFMISLLSLTGCEDNVIKGDHNVVSRERKVSNSSKIRLEGSLDLILVPDTVSRVRIVADENLIPYIATDVKGNVLEIRSEPHVSFSSYSRCDIYVSVPDLSSLEIIGSGDVKAVGEMQSEGKLTLRIIGSGNIDMPFHGPEVVSSITGDGDIVLSGTTKNAQISIAGSGDYKAFGLKSETSTASISGSGDISLFAEYKLNAKISGSGDIRYKGHASVYQEISGSGTILKVN